MTYTIELERETDGRWIAEVPGLSGVLSYGAREAEVRRQLDDRIDPEFRFTVDMLNVNVRPPLLAGKK
jgi:hypothetical protein